MKLTCLFEQRPEAPPAPPDELAVKGQTEPPVDPAAAPAPEAPVEPGQEGQAGYVGAQDGYTLDMIIGQLRGITKPWISMSSRFPEGDQRHRFIEIGERLTEIANTLERDFPQ